MYIRIDTLILFVFIFSFICINFLLIFTYICIYILLIFTRIYFFIHVSIIYIYTHITRARDDKSDITRCKIYFRLEKGQFDSAGNEGGGGAGGAGGGIVAGV